MKKLMLLVTLAFPVFLFGQNNEGKIVYNETVKLEIKIQGDASGMEHLLPKEHNNVKTLTFTASESIFEDANEGEVEEISETAEGNSFHMKMVKPENKLYKNTANGTTIELKEFFGKKFLITGEPLTYDWKLTGEQKEILGYNCQQATTEDENGVKVVWFTSEIPVPNGPGHLGQLPGMILEANLNDGKMVLVASKIELGTIEEGIVKAPTKGKAVSQEEFDEISAKKMEEMGMDGTSGSGRAVFKVIRQ
ncbi:MAG: GLPGLI family protein [Bacteroidota bacterium]